MQAKTKTAVIWGCLAVFVAGLLLMIGATFAHAQATPQGPTMIPQINTDFFVGSVNGFYPSVQNAVTLRCAAAGLGSRVIIPAGSPADGTSGYTIAAVTGGCVKVAIEDRRATPAGNYKWITTGTPAYTLQSSGGSPAAGVAQDNQFNAGGGTLDADTGLYTYNKVTHTLSRLNDNVTGYSLWSGSGSRAIAVNDPTSTVGNWTGVPAADFYSNNFRDKRNSQRDSFKSTVFGGPGGINYGNGPGVTGNLWTGSHGNYWTYYFTRRGITQNNSSDLWKRATGDFAAIYHNQVYGVGGTTGASDEGGVGHKINGGQVADYYSGTATTGAATGSVLLPVTGGGVQTCDGCFVYDASKPGLSGHFTGLPTRVTVGTASYFSEPIDTAVVPSTAYGVPVCALPQLADQTVPQTVACTVTGALGSTGAFVNGVASISGPYAEQVAITVSLPSGGSQTVNITYRYPHVSGQFMLWQGGNAQGMVQSLAGYTNLNGKPNGQTVYGAPDSTHLAAGVAYGGGEMAPHTNYSASQSVVSITKSGSIATGLIDNTIAGSYTQFKGLASATIANSAGCTGGVMDGAATAISVSFAASTISWTDASSSTGCTSATIQQPAADFAFQLYPYAEQIAAGDVSTQIVLEPNKVPWANGDSIVEPHPPTFAYNARWDQTTIHNPDSLSAGYLHLLGGAGINGNFSPFRYFNTNPCSMYQGCGGKVSLPTWFLLQGPNNGTIFSTIPANPAGIAMRFDCLAGITCNDLIHVMTFPTGQLDLHPTIGWQFKQSISSVGSGTFNGSLSAGSGITGANFVSGNGVNGPTFDAYDLFYPFVTPGYGSAFGVRWRYSGLPNGVARIRYNLDHFGVGAIYCMYFTTDVASANPLTLCSDGGGGTSTVNLNGVVNVTGPLNTPSASVLASSTTNDLAYFDNATGHVADSGVLKGALVLLNAANQFGNSTQTFGLTGAGQTQVNNTGQTGINTSLATVYSLSNTTGVGTFSGFGTLTNCSSAASPAVCGAAAAGSVAIAASATSVTVNTTAVTANSQILITPDASLGARLGVTCNSTTSVALAGFGVTARVAGTSFTLSTLGTVTTNPACYSYSIIN